jgi:hypothetical protein
MLVVPFIILLLALLALVGFAGALLALRRGGRRLVGVALLAEALLAVAALVTLCTIPVGIGNPFIRLPTRLSPLEWAGSLLALGAVAAGCFFAARLLRRWLPSGGSRLAAVAALAAVPLVAATSMLGLVYASTPARERERDPSKRTIELAPGFEWNIFVQGTIDNPTTIAFGPDGTLYIADISGALWAAADADRDGRAEMPRRFADGFDLLIGLAW